MGCASFRTISLVAVNVVALAAIATAGAVAQVGKFNVPLGNASTELSEYGRQGHLTVIYSAKIVNAHRLHPVSGSMDSHRALEAMLKGSGLKFSFTDENTVLITEQSIKARWREAWARYREQQRETDTPTPQTSAQVDIFGQRTRNDLDIPYGPTVQRISTEELQEGGSWTVPDVIRKFTFDFGGGPNEDTHDFGRDERTNTAFESSANIHGLGAAETLVLLDGRRLAPGGSAGAFTDTSAIPLTAIDHVEVMADGAASEYGADAIGGIINFVTRDQGTAPQSQVRMGNFAHGSLGEKQASQTFRTAWPGGGGILMFEYYGRDALPASDRLQATSDFTRFGSSINYDTPAGNPGTIIDPVTGETWAIPKGQSGVGLKSTDLTPGANLYDRWAGSTLLPQERRINVIASGEQRVSDDFSLFANVLLNRRWVSSQASGLTTTITVPDSNAFHVDPAGDSNPVEIMYNFGKDLGPLTTTGRVDNGQVALGFDWEVGPYWSIKAYGGRAFEVQTATERGLVNTIALTQALADGEASTAFNSFGDGSNTNLTTLAGLASAGYWRFGSSYTYGDVSAKWVLFPLPAGPIVATLGVDFRRQVFDTRVDPAGLVAVPNLELTRNTRSYYTDLQVPIVPGGESVAGLTRLGASVGLRSESYSDLGSVLTPQIGLHFLPLAGLTLDGTWSRWYRPPNLSDLSQVSNISGIFPLADPTVPGGVGTALVWSGNNANLRPERAESLNFSATFTPHAWPNFTADVKYFHVVISNRIYETLDLPLTVLTDSQYAWLVTRQPSETLRSEVCSGSTFIGVATDCLAAPITAIVDMRLQNSDSLKTSGFDASGRYDITSHAGRFEVGLDATYFLRYAEVSTPTSPVEELLNTPHNPIRLRMQGALKWKQRGVTAAAFFNFAGPYRDTGVNPARSVSSWTTVDTTLSFRFPDPSGASMITLGAENLFNSFPPAVLSTNGIAYDQENADLLGRRLSLGYERQW